MRMTEKDLEARKPFVGEIVKRLYRRDDVKRIGERSDVFQLGWIALWRASQAAEGKGLNAKQLDAYYRSAITRAILRQAKKAHKWDLASIEDAGIEVEVSESRSDSGTSRAVREALEQLAPEDANVLRWAYGIDRPKMNARQIAEVLGISHEAAGVKIRAVRERMRRLL